MKRLLILCGTVALLIVPAAQAAATATVSPVVAAQTYTITGCGYSSGQPLLVTVHEPFSLVGQNVTADMAGCFTTVWTAPGVGVYHADVYSIRKNGKSLTWLSGADFKASAP